MSRGICFFVAALGFATQCIASITDLKLNQVHVSAEAASAYLDFSRFPSRDLEVLLHPEFVFVRLDEDGKFDLWSKNEFLDDARTLVVNGSVQAVERLNAFASGVAIQFDGGQRGWLMVSVDPDDYREVKVIFSLLVVAPHADSNGMFETGERSDLVREAVGKYYLDIATGNLKSLRDKMASRWFEIHVDKEQKDWRARDREAFLDLVEERDGITRIAQDKRIVALEFMHRDLVRVSVQNGSMEYEQLFLVANAGSWLVAFYLH